MLINKKFMDFLVKKWLRCECHKTIKLVLQFFYNSYK